MVSEGGIPGHYWFVALMEDNKPVRIIAWADWVVVPPIDRPENCYMVFGKDELDAYVKACRGEILVY